MPLEYTYVMKVNGFRRRSNFFTLRHIHRRSLRPRPLDSGSQTHLRNGGALSHDILCLQTGYENSYESLLVPPKPGMGPQGSQEVVEVG